jgi:hypothetical protein
MLTCLLTLNNPHNRRRRQWTYFGENICEREEKKNYKRKADRVFKKDETSVKEIERKRERMRREQEAKNKRKEGRNGE